MTNEKAIEHLRGWLKEHYALDDTDKEVLQTAIDALERQDGDCISRKQAIGKICDAMDPPHQCGTTEEEKAFERGLALQWNKDWGIVNRILEKLPSVTPEPKWIPCSERLPENKSYVLTTIQVPGRQPHARSGWYEDGLFMNDNGDTWNKTDKEVKAWQNLPESYRED